MTETGRGRLWLEWRGFVVFVAVMLLFRSAIADWNHVPSGSMLPSILIGDRIVVDKVAYDLRVPFTLLRVASWQDPARGDVVTFNSPEDGILLVKRVIAIPGDVVSLQRNRLVINGVPAEYQAVADRQAQFAVPAGYHLYRESILGSERVVMLREDGLTTTASSFAATRIPDGYFLMLGDNRDDSRDSRMIGLVPRRNVLGQATAVAFSLDYDNFYAPRLDRLLTGLP